MTNEEWIKHMLTEQPDGADVLSWGDVRNADALEAMHLGGEPRTLTLRKIVKKGREGKKIAMLHWKELPNLPYCSQKTNQELLSRMFGTDPQKMIGKRVTLVEDKDTFGGKVVDCIRICGSPDLEKDCEHTVVYAASTGRKPKTFRLTRTVLADSAPPKERGNIESALSTIEKWTGETAPLKAKLNAMEWSKEDRVRIAEALKGKK